MFGKEHLAGYFKLVKRICNFSHQRWTLSRTGARLILPIRWVPERIAQQNFWMFEPPTHHLAWVNELQSNLYLFRDRLAQASY